MKTLELTAITAPNRFIDVDGRTLAYRSIGAGQPILLATRFRGNMDLWDPAFLDGLVSKGFRVITFDYSGLGLSTGTATYNPMEMVKDLNDLMEALNLENVVVSGWSLGGIVAQTALALHPGRISHLVLIGTNPTGEMAVLAEPLFFEVAARENYSLEDFVTLFFEPDSAPSREAARRSMERIFQRTEGLSEPVPLDFARSRLSGGVSKAPFPMDFVRETLRTTTVPILHIGGDHDIIFPVENWTVANREFPTVTLVTFPSAGHGPQHQYPEMSADIIASFIRNTQP